MICAGIMYEVIEFFSTYMKMSVCVYVLFIDTKLQLVLIEI